MRFLIIAFFTFFSDYHANDLHDSVTATFNVIEKGHVMMLEIDFDTKDYLAINTPKNYKITKEDFSAYLNKTSHWKFNGELMTPKVLSLRQMGHHTKVICFLSDIKKDLKTVEVKNEFLLDIPTHSNIIMLDVHGVFKDFRLYKDRRTLKVDYN